MFVLTTDMILCSYTELPNGQDLGQIELTTLAQINKCVMFISVILMFYKVSIKFAGSECLYSVPNMLL